MTVTSPPYPIRLSSAAAASTMRTKGNGSARPLASITMASMSRPASTVSMPPNSSSSAVQHRHPLDIVMVEST